MSIAQGFNSRMGLKVRDKYVDGRPGGTYAPVALVTESLAVSNTPIPNDILFLKQVARIRPDDGGLIASSDIVTNLTYADNKLVMVSMGKVAETDPDVHHHQYKYTLEPEIPNAIDIMIERGLETSGIPHRDWFNRGKISAMKIAGAINTAITATFSTVFSEVDLKHLGDTATFDAFGQNRVFYNDLKFEIFNNDAVDPGFEAVPISAFELALTNNLQIDSFASKASTTGGGKAILEPIRNGRRDVAFKFTVARPDTSSVYEFLSDAKKNGTSFKAKLTFESAATNYDSWIIDLPFLIVSSGGLPLVSGAGILSAEFVCTAYCDSAATTEEFTMEFNKYNS